MPSGQRQEIKAWRVSPQTEDNLKVSGAQGSEAHLTLLSLFLSMPTCASTNAFHFGLPAPAHISCTGFMPPPPLYRIRLASHRLWSHLPLSCLTPFSLLGPCLKYLTPFPNPSLQGLAQVQETWMASRQCHSALHWTLYHNLVLSSGYIQWASPVTHTELK